MKKNDRIFQAMTQTVIERIESLSVNFKQPWVRVTEHGMPRNIRGNHYNGSNVLMLLMECQVRNYRTPVFCTFKQATEDGFSVRKGEKSFPVTFYTPLLIGKKDGEASGADENNTPEEGTRIIRYMKHYNVFNLDQTDFAEKFPEKWELLMNPPKVQIPTNGYLNPLIDDMLLADSWDCPIRIKPSNQAFYSPLSDEIVCPQKEQFPQGEAFYSVLLHEMSHSTGHSSRLNRPKAGKNSNKDTYAREELIAELSGALAGVMLGISSEPQESSIAYLQSWLRCLRKSPEYLSTVLRDAARSANMIVERVAGPVNAEELQEAA